MNQQYGYYPVSVLEFVKNYREAKKYNLSPVYQRRDLWKEKEKAFFIDSIFWGKPIPSIYTKYDSKNNRHDIVDGKQRLNAILAFFENKFALPENDEDSSSYNRIRGKKYNDIVDMADTDDEIKTMLDDFHKYKLPVFIIDGAYSLEEAIDIFDRLNRGQAHNETEKLHGLYCDTEMYSSIERVMSNGMGTLIQNNLGLSPARMDDVRLCINIYLFVLSNQNVDGNERVVKERFGTYSKDYESKDFKAAEKSFQTILSYWDELNYKKGDSIYNQTNVYTIFTFLHYCVKHGIFYNDDLKEKIKEFFNKVNAKENTGCVGLYRQHRNNSKSSRDKRLKALLIYTGVRSSDSFNNNFA